MTRTARRLVRLTAVLLATASLLGLLVPGLHNGGAAAVAMLRGYDAAGLLVVPVLLLAGGSRRARPLLLGALGYTTYAAAFVLLATSWDDVFLLRVALAGSAPVALAAVLRCTPPEAPAVHGRRAVAGVLAALGLGLGGMWVAAALTQAVTGSEPAGSALVESASVVRLGIVLDLLLLVPLYLVAAWLVLRRRPWGAELAGLALVSGLVHQVAYLAALVAQRLADVPGAPWTDVGEVPVVALYLLAAVLLLTEPRREARPSAGTETACPELPVPSR